MHAIALHQVPDIEHVDLPIDRLIRIARHDFHSQHSLATTITADTSCPPFVQVRIVQSIATCGQPCIESHKRTIWGCPATSFEPMNTFLTVEKGG